MYALSTCLINVFDYKEYSIKKPWDHIASCIFMINPVKKNVRKLVCAFLLSNFHVFVVFFVFYMLQLCILQPSSDICCSRMLPNPILGVHVQEGRGNELRILHRP